MSMKLLYTFAMITVVGALTGVVSTANEQESAPYTGTVTVGEEAGKIEVALLGTRSLNIAADKIFSSISPALDGELKGKTIYLYAAEQVPDFQAYLMFHTQRRVVKAALDKAIESAGTNSCDQTDQSPGLGVRRGGREISGFLSTFDDILGYFRVDHSYDGVPLTLEDSMLVHAVAGKLSKSNWRLVLPAIYNSAVHPTSSLNVTKDLGSLIVELAQKRVEAKLKSKQCKNAAAQAEDKSGYLSAAATLDAAVDLYDAYVSELTTETGGKISLSDVLLETKIVEDLEKKGYLLVVKIQKAGGAQYIRKHIFTSLIGRQPPIFYMGGAVVSFALFKGKDGDVRAAGTFPVHGGFEKANEIYDKVDH